MPPQNPPGPLSSLLDPLALLVAALDPQWTALAYLLVAEGIAVFATWAGVALEWHSRTAVLERAEVLGTRDRAEALLAHVGAYEFAVRFVRWLGNALLVLGIGYLTLREPLTHAGDAFPWGALFGALGVTFLVIFAVNDVMVRLWARRDANGFLLKALPALEVLRLITMPLRIPMILVARYLFRVRLQTGVASAREEVLESVEEGERAGTFTPDEAEMIESIISLETSTAEDVMTARGELSMLAAETPLDEAIRFVIEDGHSRIPVYGKDREDVLGVLYAHDLIEHLAASRTERLVRHVMRSPFFVPEGKPLNDLLTELRGRRVHMAIVLNEFGGTAGVVTIEDILEQIVGDIEDEHDHTEEPVRPAENGVMDIDGQTPIEEINEALSVSLPVLDDFETVGGLVFHELGKVPQSGDELTVEGVAITVTDADARRVKRLRLRRVGEAG